MSGWASALRVLDLGFRMVIATVTGAGLGFLLDRKLGWIDRFPGCTIVGFFAGLSAGLVALVKGLTREPRSAGGETDPDRKE